MLRVCGAPIEASRAAQRACWCGGLFCGPGGARLSTRFRRVFHPPVTANTRQGFEDLIGQADLFDGDRLRDEWRARVDAFRPAPADTWRDARWNTGKGKR